MTSTATMRRPTKTTKKAVKKLTQIEAIRLIFTDGKPRTLKQLVSLVTRKTGKTTVSETGILTTLRRLCKSPHNMHVVKTPGKRNVYQYALYLTAPSKTARESEIEATAATGGPANPIRYGESESKGTEETTVNTPVAGGRSATAFANSLK